MKYTVVLEPQNEGGFTARCLELPGAITQGETRREAIENIKEAIGLILDVLSEDMESLNRTNAKVFQIELADVC